MTLSCPSCGAKLQITDDLDRFACIYCGTEQIVQRSGGIVSLKPIIESLTRVEVGLGHVQTYTSRTASELAIPRLAREIAQLEDQSRAMQWPLRLHFVSALFVVLGMLIGSAPLAIRLIYIAIAIGLSILVQSFVTGRQRPIRAALVEKRKELREHQSVLSPSTSGNS